MGEANNKILVRMLERLFAGLMNGPNLNCRPHSSRQRVDFTHVNKLRDIGAEEALRQLLGAPRSVKLSARAVPPRYSKQNSAKKPFTSKTLPLPVESKSPEKRNPIELSPEEMALQKTWSEQQAFLAKLRILADEARTYEQDTGVHVLNVGFPLLSLPPGSVGPAGRGAATRRILAPVAFVPVTITIRSGAASSVEIACKSEGVDRVSPNTALLAWLEQQTGTSAGNLFADEQGEDPWREIAELVRHVATALKLPLPELFAEQISTDATIPAPSEANKSARPESVFERLRLVPAPRADDGEAQPALVPAAVLGLFPMNNQGLLQDMQAMVADPPQAGPVESFINVTASIDPPARVPPDPEAQSEQKQPRVIRDERSVSASDPCQARAVKFARESRGLVIHGPPGTGKSQTITNIIGDHLARGQRVLMVCDKRTALDVVAHRLDHLGLGGLCALVHDPQRDQRDLYRAIREQLENLTEARSDAGAETKLARIDADLQKLHAELTSCWSLLMEKGDVDDTSFHELVGQWLAIPAPELPPTAFDRMEGGALHVLAMHEQDLRDLLVRAQKASFHENVWARCARLSLTDFLARSMEEIRGTMQECLAEARATDATAHPAIPPFARPNCTSGPIKGRGNVPDLGGQGRARTDLAERFHRVLQQVESGTRTRWAPKDLAAITRMRHKLAEVSGLTQILHAGPLDTELGLVAAADMPDFAMLSRQLTALEAYLPVASRWYAFLCWQRRSRAKEVLGRYGLVLNPANAERLQKFLIGLRARLLLQALHQELSGLPVSVKELTPDSVLDESVARHDLFFDLLNRVHTDPALGGLVEPLRQALTDPALAAVLEDGLRRSGPRADALTRLENRLAGCGLFDPAWLHQTMDDLGDGKVSVPLLAGLAEQLDTLEGVLRIRHDLARLPKDLRTVVTSLLEQSVDPDQGLAMVRKTFLAGEITHRLRTNPDLQRLDGQRLHSSFERYRSRDAEKKAVVRDAILHQWITRQQDRLLVSTGSRLNSLGADLRRRLTMRGERAMRLRQVIAIGQGMEGGDPLFDLRPIWLASPETVAQIFPRKPLFEVVIFDEASQCRLEEALPVLTRAHRVVIAGDPKQLPPTRFFESAIAVSEEEEMETDQQLFEAYQVETEDLLGAALSLAIQPCYLDVHYRSRNADLIQFSNQQFYSSRLQPIPGHPKNRVRFPPITLYRANGVYEERTNAAEADQVCHIVRDLLRRAAPPSIGIACFNLTQRDLIGEKLDELAGEDAEFAGRLAEARSRQGKGSFEGLFVKNLENVQGDERDHVIISTTYGPDPHGRFYRRFGPLGRVGGGRRLNVLVTRAREEVHLVTSIPAEVYRTVPPIPSGQAPGGAWLLFAYLGYAEQLARAYEAVDPARTAAQTIGKAMVNVRPSLSPSLFCTALAHFLAEKQHVGSDVYWGNEGFCVDLALHHPRHADDVTIGILCDGVRFRPLGDASDPVEWDLFRTAILEGQGWRLHRLWSPHFFRDAQGCTQALLRDVAELLAGEEVKDTIEVEKP